MSDMLGLIRTLYMSLTRDPDNWKLFPCLPWTWHSAWFCRALKGCFCLKSQCLDLAALGASVWIQPRALQHCRLILAAVLQCTPVAACCHHCLCFLLQCCVSAVGEEAFLRGWESAEAEGCSYSGCGCRDAEPSDCLE